MRDSSDQCTATPPRERSAELRVFELTRDRTLQVALRVVQLRCRRGSRGAEPTEGELREGTSEVKPRPSRAATGDADERAWAGECGSDASPRPEEARQLLDRLQGAAAHRLGLF